MHVTTAIGGEFAGDVTATLRSAPPPSRCEHGHCDGERKEQRPCAAVEHRERSQSSSSTRMPPSTPCKTTRTSAATPSQRSHGRCSDRHNSDQQTNGQHADRGAEQPVPVLDEHVPRTGEPVCQRIEKQVVAVRRRPIGHGHAGIGRRHQPADPHQRKRRARQARPPSDGAKEMTSRLQDSICISVEWALPTITRNSASIFGGRCPPYS